MTTGLLAIIAILLFWGFVLRDVVARWQMRRAVRRVAAPVPAPVPAADESLTLLLIGHRGETEHEITTHGIAEPPETYSYGGKTYTRKKKSHDGAWIYHRLALVLLLVSWATAAFAQSGAVTIRSSGGTELATAANPVRTDPTGTTTQPVSGTVTDNQGSANSDANSWPIHVVFGGSAIDPRQIRALTSSDQITIANASLAVTGTFWQATQPVSQSGAPWSFVGNVASGSSDSGNPLKIGGIFNTTQPTVTTGQRVDAQFSSRGELLIAKGVSGFSIDNTSFTVTQATGTNLHMVCDSGCSSSSAPADEAAFTFGTTSQTPIGGVFQTTATNNPLTSGQMGAFQVTAQRALFVNFRNASGTEIGTSSNPVRVDPTGTTTQPVSIAGNQAVNVAQFGGNNVVTGTGASGSGIPRVTVSSDSAIANLPNPVDTNAGSPSASTVRTVLADGLTECNFVSAATTNATSCKASAGQWFGMDIYNTTTTTYYLRLYNLSAAPTCSSATGFIKSIPIPGAVAAGTVGGVVRVLPIGVSYGTGIGFCITGGSSSTDNTSAATGLFGTVYYR